MKALNLTESDINIIVKENSNIPISVISFETEMFGYQATAILEFRNTTNNSSCNLGLISVSIRFRGDIDVKNIENKLKKQVKSQNIPLINNLEKSLYSDETVAMYVSVATIDTIKDKKIKNKVGNVLKKKIPGMQYEKASLSVVELGCSTDEEMKCVINYSGYYAAVLNNA